MSWVEWDYSNENGPLEVMNYDYILVEHVNGSRAIINPRIGDWECLNRDDDIAMFSLEEIPKRDFKDFLKKEELKKIENYGIF